MPQPPQSQQQLQPGAGGPDCQNGAMDQQHPQQPDPPSCVRPGGGPSGTHAVVVIAMSAGSPYSCVPPGGPQAVAVVAPQQWGVGSMAPLQQTRFGTAAGTFGGSSVVGVGGSEGGMAQ